MRAYSILWMVILHLFIAAPSAAAISEKESASFYQELNPCKGWFCYEIDPTPETDNAHAPEEVTKKPLFTGTVDWDAVWSMPPANLKELINQALSFAQEDPRDEERMLTYMKLQGIAMRRAKSFQEAWAEALLKYPVLDATVERAPTLMATNAEIAAEREDRMAAIGSMREQMGILYFYSPTCRYCQQQSVVLNSFVTKWAWRHITAINIQESPEIAARYGVQAVPDIWVAGNVKGETMQRRLGSGLVEHADLERGILQAWSLWNEGTTYERPSMSHWLTGFGDFLHDTKTNKEARP